MSCSHDRRRGMTLVELLVIVAIVGLLAVTVLPNISNTAEARRSREAARMVSTFVAKAQSRAIGRREWSGLMLMATNTVSSYAAVDLVLADTPAVYRGDTTSAAVTIPSSVGDTRTATAANGGLSMSGTWPGGAGVRRNDLIRFNGSGPLYELASDPSPTSLVFRPRGFSVGAAEDTGSQLHNTPWPPAGAPLTFEIFREPVPSGSPVSMADGQAIDLSWSGCGPPVLQVGSITFSGTNSPYRPFSIVPGSSIATAGASTSIVFDGTGRLRRVVCRLGSTSQPQAITGPVYLLVGRADRVGQPYVPSPSDDSQGANWQYPDSYWVAIDPASGTTKVAECMTMVVGTTDIDRCVSSQQWVRQSLVSNGR